MFTRAQTSDFKPSDAYAHKAESRMSHCRGHFPHLAVSPLPQCNLNPCDRYVLAISDRRGAGGDRGFRSELFDFRRKSLPALECHAFGQPGERIGRRQTFDLDEVRARMPELRVEELVFEPAVVRKEYEPLAVGIEPPGRVDVRGKRPVPGKRLSVVVSCELAQSAVGFVEEYVMKFVQ